MVPRGIILHLSASSFGDAVQINQWHLANGWSGIGYHFVILNGRRYSNSPYELGLDGSIDNGRPENLKGAHCVANNMNSCTIGICCIGNPNHIITGGVLASPTYVTSQYLTLKQFNSLVNKVTELCFKYGLNPEGSFKHPGTGITYPVISQHSQHEKGKPLCASLNITNVRNAIGEKFRSIQRDFDPGLIADYDENNFPNEDELENLEASLPEFRSPRGSISGPVDLESDIGVVYPRY